MKKIIISLTFLLTALLSYGQDKAFINLNLTDADSIAEANAEIKIYSDDKSFELQGFTDDNGLWKTQLPMGINLNIDVFRYDTVFKFTQTIPVAAYGTFEIPFHLMISVIRTSIATYTLPVYFDSNSDVIRDHDKKGIDDLFNKLDKNKSMKIEIGAHTDNVGSEVFNQNLSQKRASSIRRYLVSKGISGERIIAKGYGESKPVGDNTTEQGKAQNRRVQITVISQ